MNPGAAPASIALGAVGLVFAVSTWITWAFVRPPAAGALTFVHIASDWLPPGRAR